MEKGNTYTMVKTPFKFPTERYLTLLRGYKDCKLEKNI